eukprot:scaffold1398_cov116-Cylindrotheca_fusiformis.AAC.24
MSNGFLIIGFFVALFSAPGYSFFPISTCTGKLYSSRVIFNPSLKSSVAEDMGLKNRFQRWRFLQNLLDGEIENEDANKVLLEVLSIALTLERLGDPDDESSIEITPELREKIETVIVKTEDPMVNLDSLNLLDPLIPDQSEDEDAYKSLWDTVIELHGRESVKMNEASATPDWKLRCLKARVLLHFDFLTDGILCKLKRRLVFYETSLQEKSSSYRVSGFGSPTHSGLSKEATTLRLRTTKIKKKIRLQAGIQAESGILVNCDRYARRPLELKVLTARLSSAANYSRFPIRI